MGERSKNGNQKQAERKTFFQYSVAIIEMRRGKDAITETG